MMAANDSVEIRTLLVRGIFGVSEEERTETIPVYVSVKAFLDLRRAGASDSIEDTLDYAKLCREIQGIASAKAHFLLESFAEEIASHILRDDRVTEVSVRVEKRGIIPEVLDGVGVSIHRVR